MKPDIDEELLILYALLRSKSYCREVIRQLKESYFSNSAGLIVRVVKRYFQKYKKLPNLQTIIMEIKKELREAPNKKDQLRKVVSTIKATKDVTISIKNSYEWLIDKTKEFIKREALLNALIDCADAVEGQQDISNDTFKWAEGRVRDALSVTFVDDDLGLDYWKEVKERYERLMSSDAIVPTGYDEIDETINGGWHIKCIHVLAAETNVGKCVSGDTKIKVRNKETGEIQELSAKEFYEKTKDNNIGKD